MEYDGSIRIGTGIDTKGFDEDGKKLEAKSQKLAESISGQSEAEIKIDTSDAKKEIKEVFDDIEKEEKRIEEPVKISVERVTEQRGQENEISTPEELEYEILRIDKFEKDTEYIESRLEDLINKKKSLEQVGAQSTPLYQSTLNEIQELEEKLKSFGVEQEKSEESTKRVRTTLLTYLAEAKRELKELSEQGFGPDDAEYDSQVKKIAELNHELSLYTKSIAESAQKEIYGLDTIEGKIADVNQKIAELSKNGFGIESPEMQEQLKLRAELLETEKNIYKEASKTDAQRKAETEKQEAAQRRIEEQQERNLQKENARIQKETELQAKLQAEVAEEQRLAQIRENAVVSNDQIIAKVERLKQLEQEIADLKKVERTEGYKDYDDRIKEVSRLRQEIRDYGTTLEDIPNKFENMRTLARKAFSAVSSGFSAIGKAGSKAFSGIFSISKKLFSSITSNTKKSGGMLSTFTSRIKGLALSLLVFNWISKGFNAMISGMKAGFSNFALYSDSYAQSVQGMKNAMSTLGNQFAAAFAPIVQMVIPWLNSLIGALTTAMTYVAQFMAVLGGKSTFTKAKKIQDDYNKSLGGTAKAADKARGALADFDDLHVLEKKNDSGGGGAGGLESAADMFEEAEVDDKWKNIADWFVDMWENSDFSALGKMLGQKLKEALENISWDDIKENVRKIGESLATLINGVINVDGLGYSIGKALVEIINTGFEFLNSFVHKLNWQAIGNFIAEAVNGFFENIDWDLIYDTFVTGAKGLGDAINSFVEKINWEAISKAASKFINTFINTIYTLITTVKWDELGKKIGKAISDSLKGIEWENLGKTAGEAFNALLDFIKETVDAIDWKEVGKKIMTSITAFFGKIDWESVGETMSTFAISIFDFLSGLIDGVEWGKLPQKIIDSIKDFFNGFDYKGTFSSVGNLIGEIIAAHIDILKALQKSGINKGRELYNYFIGYFKESLSGIGEDAAWFETANAMIEGLFNGIIDKLKNVGQWVKENIIDPFVSGFKEGFGIHSPSTVMAELGQNLIEGLLLGIQEIWETLKEWFDTALEELLLFFEEKWEAIKSNAEQIWNTLKQFLTETWDNIKKVAEQTWNTLKESLSKIWKNIKETATEKFDALKLKLESVWASMKETIDSKVKNIKEKVSELMEKFTSFKTDAAEVFTNVKDSIVNSLSPVIDKLKDFIEWIRNAIDAVKDFLASGYKKIGSVAGKLFGGGDGPFAASYQAVSSVHRSLMENVPQLASGAVIRGGNPFMAILGDQPAGKTNIEAPLSTIEQALENVMSRNEYARESVPVTINLNYDGETFARLSIPDILSELDRRGYDVSVLGVT